jgi:hypothetical protein
MNIHLSHALLAIFGIALAGCNEANSPSTQSAQAQSATGSTAVATSTPPATGSLTALGKQYPLQQSAVSWDDTVAGLPKEKAQYLRKIQARYFGAFAFSDDEERQYLEAAGFPSIEEWLTAMQMSDTELKALSDTGDGKAQAIYLDRMMDRASEYLYLREINDTAYRASPGHSYSMKAYELSTQVQFSHRSPFTGYLLGAMYSTLNYPPSPESAAAGMLVAADAGDPRAATFFSDYLAHHPSLDRDLIQVARNAMDVSP